MPVSPDKLLADSRAMVMTLRDQWHAQLVETHISWVLLDGQHAWKVKKPVCLPFLDATALATRQHLCAEEVRLNRRLASSLYLDVVAITGTPQQPSLQGHGPVIDYAVRMRQFPAGVLLSEQILSGQVQATQLDHFAADLARFHRQAPVAAPDGPYGAPDTVAATVSGVLHNLSPWAPAVCDRVRQWLTEQAPLLLPTLAQRWRDGHIVEGHGDLHLGNVLNLDGTLTAFDCIEFDPALRWGDPLSDAAFLVMDCMAHGRADLGFRFLNAYLDASGDHAALPVLRYYLVYRALVRALVACLRPDTSPAPAHGPRYLDLIQHLITPTTPHLLITHGVSGSGKTFVSQGLLEQAPAIRLRSDVERKRLFGQSPTTPTQTGHTTPYGPDNTERTYAHLRHLAAISLQAGWHVIVDATFLNPTHRQLFRALAAKLTCPFTLLHCEAPDAVLRERIVHRQIKGQDASDADLSVLTQQQRDSAPLSSEEQAQALMVDTASPTLSLSALARQWLTPP